MVAMPMRYRMTLSLNVLNHLGLNLYSNVPAVLAEVVANSWDADAKNVEITLGRDFVEVFDDGIGLGRNVQDINERYLTVGYERRVHGEARTPELDRPVMGRKGIGKLSLFSIAKTVDVHSVKDGQRHSFRMDLESIREQITRNNGQYEPEPIEVAPARIRQMEHGTLIHITDFKRRWNPNASWLKKRLARRFSVIGAEYDFRVTINGTAITVADRDYLHRLQYIWTYGDHGKQLERQATNAVRKHEREGSIPGTGDVWGWVGTVDKSGALKDDGESLNKITILMRGKLAQEDILSEFGESGVYSHFLIGEINADFLDTDEEEDAATSNRQRVLEDDPRYVALKKFIQDELKHIQSQWTGIRNEDGLNKAQEMFPAIKEWYSELPRGYRESARRLFGKINQLPISSEADRRNIIKNSVIAFESLRYKDNLNKLDSVSIENLPAVAQVFADYDDIEATLYHQIVQERLSVINTLQTKVEEAVKEKVVQDHIFTHLWLLDPAWERVDGTEIIESRVTSEFGRVTTLLSHEERAGRFDIKYRTTSRKHVIIELKKPDRAVSIFDLAKQINKYRTALQKVLEEVGRATEPIEFVCIVGRRPQEWTNENEREMSRRVLAEIDARVVMYQELIDNAQSAYAEYIKKHKEAGRVYRLIQELENWEAAENEC